MGIASALVLSLAVSAAFIKLSSELDSPPNDDPLPNASLPDTPPARDRNKSPERFSPSPEPLLRVRSRSPPAMSESLSSSSPTAEFPLRHRSTSPSSTFDPVRIAGRLFRHIRFVRLIPYNNPDLIFEIRKFAFSPDKPLKVKESNNELGPLPNQEQTVLSTSDGDIFAIFERNNTILRGIYTFRFDAESLVGKRVKTNMYSGKIQDMSSKEIEEIPLGLHHPISTNFKVVILDS